MPAQNLALLDIRQRAQALCDTSDNDSHFDKSIWNAWINDGMQEMLEDAGGIEDIATYTTVVGQRLYPLPDGYLTARMLYYNGDPVEYRQLITQDFFDQGTSYIDRWSIWKEQIILGPMPPSAAYIMTLYYTRAPLQVVNDGDVPEIPNRYRHYLAYYAAAQAKMADNFHEQADNFLKIFGRGVQQYQKFERYDKKGSYLSVLQEVW